MSNEEKKKEYVLVVLRRDNEHIVISESENYDKIFEEYKELTSRWASCIKENAPFAITSPIVTTFDPGLVYEIKINPVVETTASKYDNPYSQAMNKKGLGSTFQNYDLLGEIRDQGYR